MKGDTICSYKVLLSYTTPYHRPLSMSNIYTDSKLSACVHGRKS